MNGPSRPVRRPHRPPHRRPHRPPHRRPRRSPGGRRPVAVGPSGAGDVVPLSWRVLSLMVIRAVSVAVVVAGSLVAGRPLTATAALTLAGYAVVSVTFSALALAVHDRGTALAVLGLLLCVDAVAVEAGRQLVWSGPSGVLLPAVLLASVSLLASFRTGIKLAVWQSLLTVVRDGAERSGLVAPLPGGRSLGAELLLLWLLVLVVGTAASISERELRRRRYDAEALQRFATRLNACDAPDDVLAETIRFVCDELDAGRVLACTRRGDVLRCIGGRGPDATAPTAGAWAPAGLLALTGRPGTTSRVLRLDPDSDPWLAAQLPSAGRIICVPVAAPADSTEGGADVDGGTWLVLEHRGRGSVLERRVTATAGQAGATAALAFSRAQLFQAQRLAAATDALTGLANRRTFDGLLERLARPGRPPFAVVLADVDHFKRVNDTHGHATGDDVLVAVAGVLARTVAEHAPEATPARYGGEEFVVLLPGGDAGHAAGLAERLREAVAALTEPLAVTASFGVAASELPGGARRAAADTVAAADAALYRAKEGGRNRVALDGAAPSAVPPPRSPAAAAPVAGPAGDPVRDR